MAESQISKSKLQQLAALLEKHLEEEEESDKKWTEETLEEFNKVRQVLEHVQELLRSLNKAQPISLEDTESLQSLLQDIDIDTDLEEERRRHEQESETSDSSGSETNIEEIVQEVPPQQQEEEVPDIASMYGKNDTYMSGSENMYSSETSPDQPTIYDPLQEEPKYQSPPDPNELQPTFDQAYKVKTKVQEEMEEWDKKQDEVWHDNNPQNQYHGGQQ